MIKIFFRNDDVFEANKNFILLNKVFLKRKIPIHHAVIPKKLSESSARELTELKLKYPALIEYGQHGYAHKNYGNDKVKFEFLGRAYEQQKNDINSGKNILNRMLGECFTTVFSPPYNRYNKDTLYALDELGFRMFSAHMKTKFDMNNYNFSFMPVSISFNIPLADVIKQFKFLKDNLPFIGIYLHHDIFDAHHFRNLILFINYLIKEDANFYKLSNLGGKNENMHNIF